MTAAAAIRILPCISRPLLCFRPDPPRVGFLASRLVLAPSLALAPRPGPPQHRLPPQRQGRRAHHRARLALAPPLAFVPRLPARPRHPSPAAAAAPLHLEPLPAPLLSPGPELLPQPPLLVAKLPAAALPGSRAPPPLLLPSAVAELEVCTTPYELQDPRPPLLVAELPAAAHPGPRAPPPLLLRSVAAELEASVATPSALQLRLLVAASAFGCPSTTSSSRHPDAAVAPSGRRRLCLGLPTPLGCPDPQLCFGSPPSLFLASAAAPIAGRHRCPCIRPPPLPRLPRAAAVTPAPSSCLKLS